MSQCLFAAACALEALLYSVITGEKIYIKERGVAGLALAGLAGAHRCFFVVAKQIVHKACDLPDYGWIKTMTVTSSRNRNRSDVWNEEA